MEEDAYGATQCAVTGRIFLEPKQITDGLRPEYEADEFVVKINKRPLSLSKFGWDSCLESHGQHDLERQLMQTMDNLVDVSGMQDDVRQAMFLTRLWSRLTPSANRDKIVTSLISNWDFPHAHRLYFVNETLRLRKFLGRESHQLQPHVYLCAVLDYASEPGGLVVGDTCVIHQDYLLSMRLPMLFKDGWVGDIIRLKQLTQGKKQIQFIDWSICKPILPHLKQCRESKTG